MFGKLDVQAEMVKKAPAVFYYAAGAFELGLILRMLLVVF